MEKIDQGPHYFLILFHPKLELKKGRYASANIFNSYNASAKIFHISSVLLVGITFISGRRKKISTNFVQFR